MLDLNRKFNPLDVLTDITFLALLTLTFILIRGTACSVTMVLFFLFVQLNLIRNRTPWEA